MEIINNDSIKLLESTLFSGVGDSSGEFCYYSGPFMSGKIVSSSLLSFMSSCLCLDPDYVSMLQNIIDRKRHQDSASKAQTRIIPLTIHKAYHNITYGQLFEDVLQSSLGLTSLGLFTNQMDQEIDKIVSTILKDAEIS